MKINKLTMPLVLMAVALVVGCNTDSLVTEVDTEGDGAVQLSCAAVQGVNEVQTRALTAEALPASLIPSIGEFSMTLSGEHTDKFKTPTENLPEGATIEKISENAWKVVYSTSWEKIKNIEGGYNETDKSVTLYKLKSGKFDTTNKVYLNSYNVTVNYGETTGEGEATKYVEGRNKPCFVGSSVKQNDSGEYETAQFTIKPKDKVSVDVRAKLSNSCFVMNITDWMMAYFTDIEVKIHTADNVFTFTQVVSDSGTTYNYKQEKVIVTSTTDSEGVTTQNTTYEKVEELTGLTMDEDNDGNNILKKDDEIVHIFVNPGQVISFSGKAKKAQTGTSVEFPKMAIGNDTDDNGKLAVQTRYTITVDCDTAGAQGVQIGFNEEWVPAEQVDVNLNTGGGQGNN